MKNKFTYFGINTKQRRTLSNEWIKSIGIIKEKELVEIVNAFWVKEFVAKHPLSAFSERESLKRIVG